MTDKQLYGAAPTAVDLDRARIVAWLRALAEKERERDRFSGFDDHTRRIARMIEERKYERDIFD